MRKRLRSKLIHEGQYVAEVDVELIETDESWSLYLSIEDAYRLDDVRDSLRRGDKAYEYQSVTAKCVADSSVFSDAYGQPISLTGCERI